MPSKLQIIGRVMRNFVGHTVLQTYRVDELVPPLVQLLPRSRPSQPSYTRLATSHAALTIEVLCAKLLRSSLEASNVLWSSPSFAT